MSSKGDDSDDMDLSLLRMDSEKTAATAATAECTPTKQSSVADEATRKRQADLAANQVSPLQAKLKQLSAENRAASADLGRGTQLENWTVETVRAMKLQGNVHKLSVRVGEVSDSMDGKGQPVCWMVLLDKTGGMLAVAPGELKDEFYDGRSIRLSKVQWHPLDHCLAIDKNSQLDAVTAVDVLDEPPTLEQLWDEYLQRNFTSIADLLSKNRSQEMGKFYSVRATIVAIAKLVEFPDKQQPQMKRKMLPILIQDKTGTIEVALWDVESVRLFDEGSIVEFTMFGLGSYDKKNTLNSRESYSFIKVVQASDGKVRAIPEEYKKRFSDKLAAEEMRVVGIVGRSVAIYTACATPACHLKKVHFTEQPAKCDKCGKAYNSQTETKLAVKMNVQLEMADSTQQYHYKAATIFTDSVCKLLPALKELGDGAFDDSITKQMLVDAIKLPQRITGSLANDILNIVSIIP